MFTNRCLHDTDQHHGAHRRGYVAAMGSGDKLSPRTSEAKDPSG